jgi:hypothetical protein
MSLAAWEDIEDTYEDARRPTLDHAGNLLLNKWVMVMVMKGPEGVWMMLMLMILWQGCEVGGTDVVPVLVVLPGD